MPGSPPTVAQLTKKGIACYLKSAGFKFESGGFISTAGSITIGVRLWFRMKGASDVSVLTLEVFAHSERVAEIMGKSDGLGWKSPLVSAALPLVAYGDSRLNWVIRKDHSEDIEETVSSVCEALETRGLPFLKGIKTDRDLVRVMRDTPYTNFIKPMQEKLVAIYQRFDPEL